MELIKTIRLKLDELIRSVEQARNTLVDLEDMSDDELLKLQEEFKKFRRQHQQGT
jgi:low affinity Fe/Cu permease